MFQSIDYIVKILQKLPVHLMQVQCSDTRKKTFLLYLGLFTNKTKLAILALAALLQKTSCVLL